MPTAGAAVLSSPDDSSPDDSSERLEADRGSSRTLEEVGAMAVLGAMVEQRRRASSVPAASELELELELELENDEDAVATQRRERLSPNDDVFQKIR